MKMILSMTFATVGYQSEKTKEIHTESGISELGIMVWQDFMFGCGQVSDSCFA